MSSRALVLLLAIATGCSATLHDMTYGCADGHCPSSMVCWSDQICHFGNESLIDMGMPIDMGPGNDAWTPPGPDMGGSSPCGAPCTGTDQCVVGAWNMGTPTYRCASMAQIVTDQHKRQAH